MVGGILPGKGAANLGNMPVAANNPLENTTGAAGNGGYLNEEKDAKTASTEAKFGDVLNNIQAKYGAKPKQQREIKKSLGKDDFLRIMITQMQHQDPTKPFDAQNMAQQMAQYASVEQLSNVNQNLAKMQQQHTNSDRLAVTGMIGKTVTVDRERFPHVEGTNEALSFTLPKDAVEVKVNIISENGEPITEKDLGGMKAGENNFTWDGLKSNTLPAKNGTYLFRISAKDRRGMSIQTNPQTTARVIGVSFEGGEPNLLIGDARNHSKVTLKNIVSIEDTGNAPSPTGAYPGAQVAPGAAAPKAGGMNFFGFNKGDGSQNLDPTASSPEVAAALAQYQQQQAANSAGEEKQAAVLKQFGGIEKTGEAGQEIRDGEKGFPNGLTDGEGTAPSAPSPEAMAAPGPARPVPMAPTNGGRLSAKLSKGGE